MTNLLPVTARVKLPMPRLEGLMPVRTGVGLRSVTLLEPLTDVSAALVARTVMEFGFGKVAGAV